MGKGTICFITARDVTDYDTQVLKGAYYEGYT